MSTEEKQRQPLDTLSWGDFTYTVKPFTLGNWYAVFEAVSSAGDSANATAHRFKNLCKALLVGANPKSETVLNSGGLANAILNESEDPAAAFRFEDELDFLAVSFSKKRRALVIASPDLAEPIARKEEKLTRSSRRSAKNSKEEPAQSI